MDSGKRFTDAEVKAFSANGVGDFLAKATDETPIKWGRTKTGDFKLKVIYTVAGRTSVKAHIKALNAKAFAEVVSTGKLLVLAQAMGHKSIATLERARGG